MNKYKPWTLEKNVFADGIGWFEGTGFTFKIVLTEKSVEDVSAAGVSEI